MREIVLATGNAGKVNEVQAMLAATAFRVVPQVEYAIEAPEETGLTFIENAILKARHAAAHSGRPALADDSGLVCDALDGAPGIHSARYAGPGARDADNIAKLLAALADVAPAARSCRFVCVMAYLAHPRDPRPLISEGVWEGAVALSPRGSAGFGYDPIFVVPDLGLTAAELGAEDKHARSHRGQALRGLVARLTRSVIAR
jgi:XTP/dITP diphosphohydrolase